MPPRDEPSDVPYARELILTAIELLDDDEPSIDEALGRLQEALPLMWRAHADKVTRVRNPPLTRKQKARIRFLRRTTDMSEQQIAADVGTGTGRVSEVVNGRR